MGDNENNYKEWLNSAHADLQVASTALEEWITYEFLCYHIQQTVEKSLKSLLLYNNEEIVKTHNIATLVQLIENKGMSLPNYLRGIVSFTTYNTMRYPGDWNEISKEEYEESLNLARECLNWVEHLTIRCKHELCTDNH